ncbi:ribonuclease P protein component 3 [Methanocaldococcus indicus]|uniref:ribonuclease P protein component 3 n=1 Tax=Methanocaldococcus indicus TaxID=213231 RepID=UPI003C6DB3C0
MVMDINTLNNEEDLKLFKKFNWNGFVYYQYCEDFSKDKYYEVSEIAKRLNLKVYCGVKIRAEKKKELRKKVKKFRDKCHIVMVEGGNLDINRYAVEMHDVDILSTPELNRLDSGIDHVLARFASEHRVAIEINFGYLLKKDAYERARQLIFFRRNLKLAKKYDTPVVVSTDCYDKYTIKNSYDIRAFLNTLVDREYSWKILTTLRKICEYREYLMNDNVVRYGVEIIKE